MAEKESFIELLNQAKNDLANLKSITTDGSISIRAHMKKEPNIQHGLDVWHLAKNLAKNLKKKCRTKVSIFPALTSISLQSTFIAGEQLSFRKR